MSNLSLPCSPCDINQFLSEPSTGVLHAARELEGPVGVLGAGGKVGLHMAAMLRRALDGVGRQDVKVYAVSRFGSARAREEFAKFGVETIAADLLDEPALAALPDFRTIYFMAGVKFGTASDREALRLFNEEMPARVAARFPAARFAVFSTGCVYPFSTPESGGSREEEEPAPTGEYAASCLQREKAFVAASTNHGTLVVIIRLHYTVEFRYGVLLDIAEKVNAGEPLDVTMGHVNVIWQRDAVDHVVQSIRLAASPAAYINVAGTPLVPVRELAGRFGRLLGRSPVLTGREEPTAWLNNASRAHQLFGAPRASLEEAVAWTAAWVAQGGETLGKPTMFERRDGRF
jgi:nucleoside-diphosphate-sugar epimerase